MIQKLDNWQPERSHTSGANERRVGVEIELAGLSPDVISETIQVLYGGTITVSTPLEYIVTNTELGDFKLELDASQLKALADSRPDFKNAIGPELENFGISLFDAAVDLITKAAELLVPWEIVTPPIAISKLASLEELINLLREKGALGTRNALFYAFGVHLNPELPNLRPSTILSYLRAYICLYEWIISKEHIDATRMLSPYINHFDKEYMALILDANYAPDEETLIRDYLRHNPTRNRGLDLMPLFAYLNEAQVRQAVSDPRIKSRPTFHYRLPNCDIDNPGWNLGICWSLWLQIEKLANDPARLSLFCTQYAQEVDRFTHPFENRWIEYLDDTLGEF